jgi:hypothetical protein
VQWALGLPFEQLGGVELGSEHLACSSFLPGTEFRVQPVDLQVFYFYESTAQPELPAHSVTVHTASGGLGGRFAVCAPYA